MMPEPLHILYAIHGYKPAYRIGGPIWSVSAAAEWLVRKGHRVTVFTTNSNLDEDLEIETDRPLSVDGVEVWYFRREEYFRKYLPFIPYLAKSSGFVYAPRMRAELRRIMPSVDAVHTHLPFVYPTLAAARAAKAFARPLFYHQRGVFDPARLRFRSFKKRLYIDLVERPVMRAATTLFALTDAEIASYRALGVRTQCKKIPNGIDVDRYPTREQAPMLDPAWGIHDDDTVVLFLGRLHPIKGADRLLDAFLALPAEQARTTRLVMAGPDEFGLEAMYKRRAGERAGAHVIFPGMVSGERKQALLARADLFSLPSDAEGFSMAVLEALASGTAVLLSPGCHFDEVEDAGAGRIVGLDHSTLARALAEMVVDREALRESGRRGRALVERNYTWDTITDRIIGAYYEGIERARRPSS